MARAKKYETYNGLQFNSIYTNNVGSVIKTRTSIGYRVVDNDFKHLGFFLDALTAEEFLDAKEAVAKKIAA